MRQINYYDLSARKRRKGEKMSRENFCLMVIEVFMKKKRKE